MAKRIPVLLICLIMLISLLAPAAYAEPEAPAEEPAEECCPEEIAPEDVGPVEEQLAAPAEEDCAELVPESINEDPIVAYIDYQGENQQGFATLSDAVASAAANNVITLVADVTLTSRLTIGKNLTITDDGNARLIQLQSSGKGIEVSAGSTLDLCGTAAGNLTITGRREVCEESDGQIVYRNNYNHNQLIYVYGTLNVEKTVIEDGLQNFSSGGAIYVNGGTVYLKSGTTISNCGVGDGLNGGGVYVNSSGTLTMNSGAVIDGCSAGKNGGGVSCSGTFVMNGGTISNCSAAENGGGVYVETGAALTMSSGVITGNSSASQTGGGGGIYSLGTLTISGGVISGNEAVNYGGGVRIEGGTANICGGVFYGNNSKSSGTFVKQISRSGDGRILTGGWYSAKADSGYVASGYYRTGQCADAPDTHAKYTVSASQTYSITYMDGAETLNTATGTAESAVTLDTPEKQGYLFDGWYLTQTFQGAAFEGGSGAEFSKDTTLYSKWTEIVPEYVASVKIGDAEAKNFTTINEAFQEAVKDNNTEATVITLLGNCSGTGQLAIRTTTDTSDHTAYHITLDLNGFTLTNYTQGDAAPYNVFLLNRNGNLTVLGSGTVDCKGKPIFYMNDGTGSVVVEGGTFINVGSSLATGKGTGSLMISGGTFSADPSGSLAPGCMAEHNEGTGTWTVVKAVCFTRTNNLNLSSDLKFGFYFENENDSQNVKAVFTMAGKTKEVTDYSVNGDKKYFVFDGISPQYIGTDVKAELYVGDEKVDEFTRSILDYVGAIFGSSSGRYDDVIRDLVDYGLAANSYVEEKNMDRGTDYARPDWLSGNTASTALPAEADYKYYKSDAQEGFADYDFKGVNVLFDVTNTLRIRFTMPAGGTLYDGSTEISSGDLVASGNNEYLYFKRDLKASEYTEMYTFSLKSGGDTVRTFTYGIGSYAFSKYQGADGVMKDLALATFRYGLSAKALIGQNS